MHRRNFLGLIGAAPFVGFIPLSNIPGISTVPQVPTVSHDELKEIMRGFGEYRYYCTRGNAKTISDGLYSIVQLLRENSNATS